MNQLGLFDAPPPPPVHGPQLPLKPLQAEKEDSESLGQPPRQSGPDHHALAKQIQDRCAIAFNSKTNKAGFLLAGVRGTGQSSYLPKLYVSCKGRLTPFNLKDWSVLPPDPIPFEVGHKVWVATPSGPKKVELISRRYDTENLPDHDWNALSEQFTSTFPFSSKRMYRTIEEAIIKCLRTAPTFRDGPGAIQR